MRRLLIGCVCLLVATGCLLSPRTPDPIEGGTWQSEDGSVTLILNPDGTASVEGLPYSRENCGEQFPPLDGQGRWWEDEPKSIFLYLDSGIGLEFFGDGARADWSVLNYYDCGIDWPDVELTSR